MAQIATEIKYADFPFVKERPKKEIKEAALNGDVDIFGMRFEDDDFEQANGALPPNRIAHVNPEPRPIFHRRDLSYASDYGDEGMGGLFGDDY